MSPPSPPLLPRSPPPPRLPPSRPPLQPQHPRLQVQEAEQQQQQQHEQPGTGVAFVQRRFMGQNRTVAVARQNASARQEPPGQLGPNREALRREALDAQAPRTEVCETFSPDEWYRQVEGNWAVYMGEEEGTDYRQTYRWLDTLKSLGGNLETG